MTEPIILYDIPSTTSVNAWSPNTWKVRYALNYKGLAYKTEWVEYPDIAPLCKKIGAPPTEKKADGSDYFSLPVIYDPKTKKIVVDSAQIVKYLDEAYPNTPKLFPPGTSAFQAAFLAFFGPAVSFPSLQIVLARTAYALNPPSQAYFRETREKIFGKLEDRNTPQFWEELEKGLGQVKTFLEANGEGKELSFLGENKFTLSDFQVAANLIWLRTVLGEGSEDWKRILAFHGGFPGRFFVQFEGYHAVH